MVYPRISKCTMENESKIMIVFQGTVKKALSEFKRTHQDCWHEHKQRFSDDQLAVLTDLLVSPNYYV